MKTGLVFDFSQAKNILLKEARGVDFDDVIKAIDSGNLLDDTSNPNQKKYPGQKIFVVKIKGYAYLVPYLIDKERRKIFLKTLYPNRKATKKYLDK
ncbi:MAG: toxin [Candidatus Pacebacteria bacterium CG10_big_fil_rev_8_21_14_0_10_56_10]|nr:MAG: toxin [Candidatus Pacebacteria bacterium CG10_big_fil_rev_8_21_14_0_10_56_10]